MKKTVLLLSFMLGLLVLGSCSKDDPDVAKAPSVSFTDPEGIFEVKVGRSISLEPTITDAVSPFFVWKQDSKIVSRELSYEFSSKTAGQHFLTFQVNAANGSVEKELRIDVLELAPPKVQLPSVDGYIQAVTGRKLLITPDVTHSEGAAYRWLLNREEVSNTETYTFEQVELGDYNLVLIVENEDGEGRAEAVVRVGEVPELAIHFDVKELTVPLGRSLQLAPYITYGSESTQYEWKVDGSAQAEADKAIFIFTPSEKKEYTIRVDGKDGEYISSATITVICVDAEGTYFRPATATSSPKSIKVFDFLPAPGQHNSWYGPFSSQEQANDYATQQMASGGLIALGGFGGYIVVGFDHSVENKPGNNLAIQGNAFAGSSEPGIVWVMQDENGNGLPDDTWYELKGSETGKAETRQLYAITYFKPATSGQSIRWTDNYGGSGYLAPMSSKYPTWISAPSYTLRGTCLKPRNVDQSGNGTYWYNGEYDWGYVDNYGNDYVGNETVLDLNNAIYPDGTPANLQYIDFVKVHTAVNAESGWLGEIGTDLFGFRDMNLNE